MTNYYLDLETQGFNPESDKVITIQYQELDGNCNPKGPLIKLKEWEIGEEMMMKLFHRKLMEGGSWGFVPVGQNLIFDFTFLSSKFKKYGLEFDDLSKYIYNKPMVDIKHSLIIANDVEFKGSGLDQMTNKKTDGRAIPTFYKNKEYDKIEEYIDQETESFLEAFQKLRLVLKEAFKKNV